MPGAIRSDRETEDAVLTATGERHLPETTTALGAMPGLLGLAAL